MLELTRKGLADELAKVAIAVDQDAVAGVFLIAVHANGTSTELLVPPSTKGGVEKLMLAVDRLHFRAQVACYLGAKKVGESAPNAGEAPSTEQTQ